MWSDDKTQGAKSNPRGMAALRRKRDRDDGEEEAATAAAARFAAAAAAAQARSDLFRRAVTVAGTTARASKAGVAAEAAAAGGEDPKRAEDRRRRQARLDARLDARVKAFEDEVRVHGTSARQLRAAAAARLDEAAAAAVVATVSKLADRVLSTEEAEAVPGFVGVSEGPAKVEVLEYRWALNGSKPCLLRLVVREVDTGFTVSLPVAGVALPPMTPELLWSDARFPPLPAAARMGFEVVAWPAAPDAGRTPARLPASAALAAFKQLQEELLMLVTHERTLFPGRAKLWKELGSSVETLVGWTFGCYDERRGISYSLFRDATGMRRLLQLRHADLACRSVALPRTTGLFPADRVAQVGDNLVVCWGWSSLGVLVRTDTLALTGEVVYDLASVVALPGFRHVGVVNRGSRVKTTDAMANLADGSGCGNER